jgi:glycosyltransferase involved in cell wall biosynthesis
MLRSHSKPNLLYVSLERPALNGSGSAMRAGMNLEALAVDFNVHLLVIPVVGTKNLDGLSPAFAEWCSRIEMRQPAELNDTIRADTVFAAVDFQEVHAFRLAMAPFCEPFLSRPTGDRRRCTLDLDDFESKKWSRLAALHESTGDSAAAEAARLEAVRYERMEKVYLPRFDRVYLSNGSDLDELARAYGCDSSLLPNAVRIPSHPPLPGRHPVFTLLFVGNLEYAPNEDAVLFFCRNVVPLLRQQAPCPYRILIVGARPSERVSELAAIDEVTVTGRLEEIADCYRQTAVAVVPLRTGGGTRIKILEAFSYHCPTVSTSVGAEGLEVRSGRELLIADTPSEFARCCVTLMRDPARRRRMADAAFEWIRKHHTVRQVRNALRDSVRDR